MQIHRIHEEHRQFTAADKSHLVTPTGSPYGHGSVKNYAAGAGSLQKTAASEEIVSLVEQLRTQPGHDPAAVELAKERFRSGGLLTREAAEFVATSLLRDFNF